MATVEVSELIESPLAETWDAYFDERRWPAWVEGFGSTTARREYPQAGGTLSWSSTAAGRGLVSERVLDHEPRRRHRIHFEDPESVGNLETTFSIEGECTRVAQKLDYRLKRRGPFAAFADLLFIRSQLASSMQRSLAALRRELDPPR